MRRTLITGWPRSGKSTLAGQLAIEQGLSPIATDSLMTTHSWSEASEAISYWFDEPSPWIIEGVVIPRALRKWRARHPDKYPPFDLLIILPMPELELLKPGQITMGKGMDTVLLELAEWMADAPCCVSDHS